MKSILAAAFVASVLATDANANTGYFTGSGHTITLTKTEQVQLVSEDVTIRPNCGWEPSMDSVDYRCKFVLKNLTAKPLKIQVGFPLDYQILQAAPQAPNPTDLVLNYGFIAREDANTYHVRYVPNDSEEKFSRLFVWDMTFDAAETKILHVVYRLRMSEAISSTRKHLTTQQCFLGTKSDGTRLWKCASWSTSTTSPRLVNRGQASLNTRLSESRRDWRSVYENGPRCGLSRQSLSLTNQIGRNPSQFP